MQCVSSASQADSRTFHSAVTDLAGLVSHAEWPVPIMLGLAFVLQLLKMPPAAPLHHEPLWSRGLHGPELVQAFKHECHVVRKGLDGDLIKVCTDLHQPCGMPCDSAKPVCMYACQTAMT